MSIQDLGANVRRHMKLQGMTIPDLAAKIDMGTAYMSNLLNGKADPKSSTLMALSEALGVPMQDLVAEVPALATLRFRSAKALSAREKAERDQLEHITAKWISDYKFLEGLSGNGLPYKLKNLSFGSPVEAAAAVRRHHSLELRPIHDIVDLVNSSGIKLRVIGFGYKKTFGLSLGEADGGPAIVVNSEQGISVERQIFTIAHELGHLVLHSSSYDSSQSTESEVEEREANLFASHLLLPEQALDASWKECRGLHWVNAVLSIKKKFRVSYKTVLYRLQERQKGFGSRNLSMEFAMAYRVLHGHDLKDHYEPGAIEEPVARQEDDPLSVSDLNNDPFSRLVVEAVEANEISMGRAAEMLNLSIEDLRQILRGWQDL